LDSGWWDGGNNNQPELMNKRTIKRFWVGAAGGIVLAAGFAMIVLPGPAIVVIPLGLAILATEFAWAKRWLEKVKLIALKAKRIFEKKKKVS
jgi:tellurite resistance protein TerC